MIIQALDEAALDAPRTSAVDPEVQERVREILADVSGDSDALRRFTLQFDGVDLADPWLDEDAWDALADACPPPVRAAIDNNLARIRAFHGLQVGREQQIEVAPGIVLGRRPIPYARVACYVPGGLASYPSTVMMTVTPAVLAGVEDVIVVTPPQADGSIDPAVAYAARAAGATRILRAGGAQAVGALAFGSGAPRVDAIVGPGNAYVTAAKQVVQDIVHIDSPAGPSELVVLADDTAPAAAIALDMLAQAEHDPDAEVLLITPSRPLAEAVQEELRDRAPHTVRAGVIQESLEHGRIIVTPDWDSAIAATNAYAPEHLEIMSRDPRADLEAIRHAGSVFLGVHAPVSLGDYGSGTNHVLPTMGHARRQGGLSVDDFRKWITWQDVTADGLAAVADDITFLADAEGLHAHADAVRSR